MTDLFPPSIDEQIACVEREIRLREFVYPRRVRDKRLTQAKADRELETMRAIKATLEGLKGNGRND
jgi:hypothetical protein